MLVGAEEHAADLSGFGEVLVAGRVSDVREISIDRRPDLAIVIDQVEEMPREEAAHLLSRLRDILCDRVLLILRDERWRRTELLALGFLELGCKSGERRVYLFDPALFNEPRDPDESGQSLSNKTTSRYY